jgi:hypothetical protein
VDKVKRYDWAKPGDTGVLRKVNEADLLIDHSYQRSEVAAANTLYMARNFQWSAFGCIVVMQRDNGEYYIVDGQQRVLAMRHRGDMAGRKVPCVVFKSDGPLHEAAAFIDLNTRRRPVRSVDKFNACVMAGVEPETSINNWLKGIGMTVANSHKNTNSRLIDFPTSLVQHWNKDIEATKSAIQAQFLINNGESLHSAIHKGLWYLFHFNVDVFAHVPTIRSAGGKIAILQAIKGLRIELGTGETACLCGRAILSIINRRKRNKVVLSHDEAFNKSLKEV